ncbi:MAG: lamin tail domain-containing protein [Verrucomicrobiae bacterium]|nr:lamin tail domain-containing protein [Verrucomicrobiae bacterium]
MRLLDVLRSVLLFLLCCLSGFCGARGAILVDADAEWRFFRGLEHPSPGAPTGWTTLPFDDARWETGRATFYYGETGFTGTELSDMAGRYPTLFLRHWFFVENPANLTDVELRAICDDGFVAYLNGVRIASLNAPASNPSNTTLATANASEPVPWQLYPVANAASLLVAGENVLAVVVLNTSLGSSDLVFAGELSATEIVSGPPSVASVSPAPGVLTQLRQITVTFDKPVTGVTARDFLINGFSATSVTGSGTRYTFNFSQPAYGTVSIGWGPLHEIRDLGTPPQPFSGSAPGSVWAYELLDPDGPSVIRRQPPAGITVRQLREMEVIFNRAVSGLDAADLLLNGTPAVSVTGLGAGPYRFTFAAPAATGTAAFSWASDHGIASEEAMPHAFTGSSWTCTVDPAAARPDLVINELLAENLSGRKDEDQDPEDWIELRTRGAAPVNLAGWAIGTSGDASEAWVFPAVTVPAGGYLRVWASGKDRREIVAGRDLHTDFKLNPNGDTLRLFGPELPRELADSIKYGRQGADYSFGRQGGVGAGDDVWRYFATPTPGAANGVSTVTDAVADVHFSVERGFYDSPFQLTLACATPGAVIRYTTNGSPPLGNNGFLYDGPILIAANRVIRAAATLENYVPSGIQTHTYLYNLPARQRSLPALSLVTATNNLYGRTGIMESNPRNTQNHGPAWERPVSVEYLRPADNSGFHVDAGLRIQGGGYIRGIYNYRSSSLPESKYSFRLYFRGEYGQGRLNYRLFPGTTVESFDTLVLRAGMNDHSNPFIKDELCRQLSSDLGLVASHGTFVHLFLNGVYRGYYNPTERIDDDFLQTYHGGGENWDLMASSSELREGDAASWNQLMQLAQTTLATNTANYLKYQSRLDLTNFVDYLLMPIYVDADDWPHNNWRAARERMSGSLWRFYHWDVEWSFGDPDGHSVSFNTITGQLSATSPPWGGAEIARLFNALKRNPEFRMLFADRAHRALFNGGALTDEHLRARFEQIKAALQVSVTIPGFRNAMIANWITGRRRHVLTHLDRAGFLQSSNAPAFAPFGGVVPAGFPLEITNLSGTIYYTTDGSDPRVPFTDEVAPTARPYTGPILVDHPMLLRTRSLSETNWSALSEASFQVGAAGVSVRITELMYHPPGGDAYEFIELANTGSTPVDLSGFQFDGVNFRFATPFPLLAPGARLVLASDAQPASFAARYPGVAVAGYFGGALSNGGERIALLDREGRVVDAVTYRDDGAWPRAADGEGASLELASLTGDPNAPATWQSSTRPGGTPGAANGAPVRPAVEIHEIAASVAGKDWIELHNRGESPVALENWSLTDDPEQPRRYVLPAGTVLAPGGYLRIAADAAGSASGLNTRFGLDADGETLALFDAATNVVDSIAFGPQARGYTLGRVGEEGGWTLCDPTPGDRNEPAAAAPVSALALNEFLADSEDGDDWIELHNTSELPAVVTGCFLSTSNALHRVRAPVFVAPGGFAVLIADEVPGPSHLPFKLPASGGRIALADPDGIPVTEVIYGSQTPLVSLGRLPDGAGDWTPLPFSATPGASNALAAPGATVRFSELMARNESAAIAPGGRIADWVEIENGDTNTVDLGGAELRLNGLTGAAFPPGFRLEPGARTLVWATSDRLPGAALNLGVGLPDQGATLELVDARGRLLDRLAYGSQLADQTAGRTDAEWTLLGSATPGAANAPAAPLADPSQVRINEWLAVTSTDSEWFELVNLDPLPVDLGGCFLTDDPSLGGITRFPIAPLSFVPGGGFARYFADGEPELGPDHVNFRLSQFGETLRLSQRNRALVDAVSFAVQSTNVSEGRLPDGSPRILRLPEPSPLAPNAPDYDGDGDGLPDAWEYRAGLDPNDPLDAALDPDGDGFDNRSEYAAGTDPQDAASALRLAVTVTAEGQVRLRFHAVEGRAYRLAVRTTLAGEAEWTPILDIPAGVIPHEMWHTDTAPYDPALDRFYRVILR